MEKMYILSLNLYLMILLNMIHCITEDAEDEYGSFIYPMCVKSELPFDILSGNRHADQFVFKNNTGIICKMKCKAAFFRFAGTKKKSCWCAENIRKDVKTGTCDFRCPGDADEVCGGTDEISLYDTGFRKTEPTAGEVTTETTEQLTNSTRALSNMTNLVTTETQTTSAITETAHGSSIASLDGKVSSETGHTDTWRQPHPSSPSAIIQTTGYTSAATVVYIVLPVLIVVSVITVLVVCVVLRRRRVNPESNVSFHTTGFEHSDRVYKTSKNLYRDKSAADCGTEYSTPFLADDQTVNAYGSLKMQPGMNLTIHSEYAHVATISPNSKLTYNTYSHVRNGRSGGNSTDKEPESDNTYNTLQGSSKSHVADSASNPEEVPDAVYDHAKAGVKYKKGNREDEYEHINSI